MPSDIQTAFVLGLMVSDSIHGNGTRSSGEISDAVYGLLEQIASGEITMMNTLEEFMAKAPKPPAELLEKRPDLVKAKFDQMAQMYAAQVGGVIRKQREMAATVLHVLKTA